VPAAAVPPPPRFLDTSIAEKQRLEFFISFGVSLFSSLCSFLADALRLCYAFV
jgi:hypothetical protein